MLRKCKLGMVNGYHMHGMTKYCNILDQLSADDMDSIARMDQMFAPIRLAMRLADKKTIRRSK
jgi:hypothetical protein